VNTGAAEVGEHEFERVEILAMGQAHAEEISSWSYPGVYSFYREPMRPLQSWAASRRTASGPRRLTAVELAAVCPGESGAGARRARTGTSSRTPCSCLPGS
jgi:hypothetical protein